LYPAAVNLLVYSFALLPGLGAVAIGAGQAAAQGRRPWVPLAVVWLAVAGAQYFALLKPPAHPAPAVLALLAPLGVAALAVEMEVQRGCSLWRAGSVGVLLGLSVAGGMPLLFGYLTLVITCVARGTCL
jgi:hypothetical protein